MSPGAFKVDPHFRNTENARKFVYELSGRVENIRCFSGFYLCAVATGFPFKFCGGNPFPLTFHLREWSIQSHLLYSFLHKIIVYYIVNKSDRTYTLWYKLLEINQQQQKINICLKT